MCGLAVLLALPGKRVEPRLCAEFDAALAHRGPDASGLATFKRNGDPCDPAVAELALIHRRLAIIDLDARAGQPMSSPDGRYTLIYNGEIYNYLELRAELEQGGQQFRTESDSEVLIAAFAAWGERALSRFTGMFAFVLFDQLRHELFIARDPFGIKPLFWTFGSGAIAVASEIGPLLDVPGVSRRADTTNVCLYLSTGQTGAGVRTMFADIRSFPAGCYAKISLDKPAAPVPVRYWQPTIAPQERSFAESARELREAFLDSINLHLRSDVPVGAALSGGIDSSSIIACARKIGGQDLAIRTFSFIAPGSSVDESSFIDIAARSCAASSQLVQVNPDDIIADIDELIRVQGEPFGSLSIYAQYRVMRLASQNGIKVMLDGQGADELFAGYRPYLARRLSQLLATYRFGAAASFVAAISRLPGANLGLIAQAFEPCVPSAQRAWLRQMIGRPTMAPWINQEWFAARGVFATPTALRRNGHLLHDSLEQSLTETVLPALLRYEDRNSMAFSIESRVPFLTTRLADLAYSMPAEHLIDGAATSKSVLRAAMRGIVPDQILDRRDKIGFATPDELWSQALRPWMEDILKSDTARSMGWLKGNSALNALADRMASSRPFGPDIWRLVNLLRWAQVFGGQFE
jgi:asparagine synthase (glutamine-hydrolysing)